MVGSEGEAVCSGGKNGKVPGQGDRDVVSHDGPAVGYDTVKGVDGRVAENFRDPEGFGSLIYPGRSAGLQNPSLVKDGDIASQHQCL